MGSLLRFIEYVAISGGMAIAVGCYMAIGEMAAAIPLWIIPVSILIGAIVCILAANSIANLARRYPTSVGVRAYVKAAFGESTSVAISLFLLNIVCIFSGVEAYLLANVLKVIWTEISIEFVTILSMPLIAMLNVVGIELPRKYQIFTTFTLLIGMMGLSWWAISTADPASLITHQDPMPIGEGALMLITGIVLSVFLFIGFEWVTPLGRKKEDYGRLIPYAMIAAILVLAITYASFSYSLAYIDASVLESFRTMPHLALGDTISGNTGIYIMVFLSLLALSTTLNAGILGTSRLVYGMGRDGALPSFVSGVSYRFGTPVTAIVLICCLSILYVVVELVYGLHQMAIILCVSGYSLVYGVLILSSAKLSQELGSSKLVKTKDYILGVLFIGLSLIAAFSNEEFSGFPALVILSLLTLCVMFAKRSSLLRFAAMRGNGMEQES